VLAGVVENKLEVQTAPSGLLLVTGGILVAMIELRGSAKPRIPLKLGDNGSMLTSVTAAVCGEEGLISHSALDSKSKRSYQELDGRQYNLR